MDNAAGWFYVVLVVLGLVLAVLWVLMPIAIFRIKDLQRALLEEQRQTNELLRQIAARR